jgi:putative flippase GtrA
MWLLGLNEAAANFLGYSLGLAFSYTANRAWTFADNQAVSRSLPRWLAAAMVAYLVNLAVVVGATRLAGIDPYLAQLLGIAPYTATMFLAGRCYVFSAAPALSRKTE